MAEDKMNDNVGRKIVEALKMQSVEHSDGEVFVNDDMSVNFDDTQNYDNSQMLETSEPVFSDSQETVSSFGMPSERQMKIQSQLQFQAATQPQSIIDTAFNQSLSAEAFLLEFSSSFHHLLGEPLLLCVLLTVTEEKWGEEQRWIEFHKLSS